MKFFNLFLLSFLAQINTSFANVHGENWQLGFLEPKSPLARNTIAMHDFIMYFMYGIVAFVLLLLIITCFRFSAKRNKKPSTTSHNTILEVIWIVIPVIILIIIGIPSIKQLAERTTIPDAEMTLKVVGRQWYWSYEYPDHGNIYFDSYMKKEADLLPGEQRLLATDTKIVLPTETYIRVQMTSSDVIHAWAVPKLGVKMDAIPGRLNETWIYIEEPGTYYGQCSELCGILHAFMPIEIKAVSKEEFAIWVEQAKEEFASLNNLTIANNLIEVK